MMSTISMISLSVIPAEKDVKDDSERPHVTRGGRSHLAQSFWGHVVYGTKETDDGIGFALNVTEPKVHDLEGGVFVRRQKKTVLRFEVPVGDASSVQVVQTARDLMDYFRSSCLGVSLLLHDAVEELTS